MYDFGPDNWYIPYRAQKLLQFQSNDENLNIPLVGIGLGLRVFLIGSE